VRIRCGRATVTGGKPAEATVCYAGGKAGHCGPGARRRLVATAAVCGKGSTVSRIGNMPGLVTDDSLCLFCLVVVWGLDVWVGCPFIFLERSVLCRPMFLVFRQLGRGAS
jgi:hypothetical protein